MDKSLTDGRKIEFLKMKFEGYLYDMAETPVPETPDGHLTLSDGHPAVPDGHLTLSDGHPAVPDGHLNTADGTFSFLIVLRPDSPVYAGHFPGLPVTPGVALLAIVRELLEKRLRTPLTLTSADDVKFLHPLTPCHNPVTVTFRAIQGNSAKAEITSSAGLHARMSLTYRSSI